MKEERRARTIARSIDDDGGHDGGRPGIGICPGFQRRSAVGEPRARRSWGRTCRRADDHAVPPGGEPDDPIERASSRPDVAILCYPVITMTTPYTHMGSRINLLGDNPAPALIDKFSNEKQVTSLTPPTFIFHTAEDKAVPLENALSFAA